MVDAFLTVVFDNLNSLVQQQLGSLWGVDEQMERLSSTLSMIRAVIEDAEEKQLNDDDRAIKNWLQKLSDASHVLDDVLDKFEMEASRVEFEKQESRWKKLKVCSSFSSFLGPTNPLFRWRIAKEMREVGERLDKIANERLKFHLREVVGEKKTQLRERRQSSSFVTQPKVYGREEDREKVVKFLVLDARNREDVSIYPFVGMGGIGKTTLAQLVFNDERVCGHFELRVWVYVSEDFDVKRVMKAIIESSSGSTCDALEMDPLQRHLREIIQGKKFLIVLDDIWNEDQEQWDRLKHVLNCGSMGSSIIVTTRLKKVAAITGTTPMHHLFGLSEDDCWSLFKQRAFGDEKEEQPKLVKIGKEIVRKCGGVPLAAKALGGLLRFKRGESEWISIMQSELWNVLRDENSVLPALKLSYLSLPVEQRRCFAFCALFPKNSRIEKERIIRLWMANGFICSLGQVEVEEIGRRIFDDLYWRSFFQDYKKDYFGKWSFKMHDLVHDLASFIMEDECYHEKVNGEKPSIFPTRVHYLASTYSDQSCSYIKTCKSLRTLVLLSKDYQPISLDCHVNFPSLRALDVEHFSLKSISSMISISKHLRYLNLSYTDIKIIPESICKLQSLQTLNLTGCGQIQKLPTNLNCLRKLRHLDISGCVQLSRMPSHIGRLTSLRTLSIFVVDDKKGCRLDELEGLSLGGDLELKGLEKVRSSMDARKAYLAGKRNINKLSLGWGTVGTKFNGIVEYVLEALEPSPSLTVLEIKNYEGLCFPHWLSNGVLQNVVSVTLSTCKNCSNLPTLNKLPLLKYLYIHQMDRVRYMVNDESPSDFMCLENLMIRNLPNLELLSQNHEVKIFPCLSELYISHCYKFATLPLIPSLKKLEVWKSHKGLLDSIPNFQDLTSLDLSKIDGVTHFPDQILQNLTSLQTLRMAYFPDLQELPSTMLIGLKCLERIHIRYCDQLECFPEEFFHSSNHLKCITIENCKKLRSLSESFRYLTALQSLELRGCPELMAFPSSLNHLSSLQHLILSGHCRSASQCSTSKMDALPESLQYLPSLESIIICDFPNLTALPDWLGNLASLHELHVRNCPNIVSMPRSIQLLSNLQTLSIE